MCESDASGKGYSGTVRAKPGARCTLFYLLMAGITCTAQEWRFVVSTFVIDSGPGYTNGLCRMLISLSGRAYTTFNLGVFGWLGESRRKSQLA